MNWWLLRPSRARAERTAISELEQKSTWLETIKWRWAEDFHLILDFEITHLESKISFTLTYPHFFPDVPPQIRPGSNIRLSRHQYGAGGELCLEYRPDNWSPEITGAMMIESAYRLISGESADGGSESEVLDAHRQTLAQQVRSSKCRFLLPSALVPQLQSLKEDVPFECSIEEHVQAKTLIANPVRIGPAESPEWIGISNSLMPVARNGYAIRLSDVSDIVFEGDYASLQSVVEAVGVDAITLLLDESKEEIPFLISHRGIIQLVALSKGAHSRTVYNYDTVLLPNDEGRLPPGYVALKQKSVALIGCGSVGSKIAASLARAGVEKFVLVDCDLLFPGNLVRNDLDMSAVGVSKTDAVATRLDMINPNVSVIKRHVLLGGQESSNATEVTFSNIAKCDLVIDATADARTFNLCASVTRSEKIPLIWGEVFAGGIGGLVVRLRPNVEPTPHAARRQIAKWCDDRGIPCTLIAAREYETITDDAVPLIADDADVTMIAAHMTRMAIDVLTAENADSIFPAPAYAIGLKAGWIFEAPFDTWPIGLVQEGDWGRDADENLDEEFEAMVSELFPNLQQENNADRDPKIYPEKTV